MTESLLNQIFYTYKKFDADKIDEFLPWMLSKDALSKLEDDLITEVLQEGLPLIPPFVPPPAEEKDERDEKEEKEEPPSAKENTMNTLNHLNARVSSVFSPNKMDTLFWCVYVIFHGESEYHMIGNRFRNTEIDEKQRVMEFIKKNADTFRGVLQGIKITKVAVQEILSDLMLNKKTSLQTFAALCYYYKISAIITYNKTGYECISTQEQPIYHFTRTQDGHISVDTEPLTQDTIETIRQSHIILEYTKTIKSIGAYKVQDLLSMANVLGIEEPANAKWKKVDWYQAITDRCLW
jgi:hypothetical protein